MNGILKTFSQQVYTYLIIGYQRCISPFLGTRCRFFPTCSEYSKLAVEKHGIYLGFKKTILRIIKCHPFHPGGVDYP